MQSSSPRPPRHRLLLELGRGGMGTVYLAVVDGDARRAALRVVKRLRPDLASDAEFVQMFVEEARLAALLSHPNIVETGKVGFDDRHYFIEMEYLDGQSLFAIVRRAAKSGGVPLRVSLSVLAEVLAGLAHAHDAADEEGRPLEIVHRDVSPHNVLVTYAGEVKLLDFGIAKAVDSSLQTRTGVVKGKATYMAPEQALRRPVDRRADVFAVGVMLWEAITGARLHADLDEGEIRARFATLEIPRPRSLRPETSEELDAVCMRALAMAPDDRYASATEMRAALVAAAGSAPDREELAAFVAGSFAEERARLDRDIDALLRQPLDALGVNVDVPLRPELESGVPTPRAGQGAAFTRLHSPVVAPAALERPRRSVPLLRRSGLMAAAAIAFALTLSVALYVRAHRTPAGNAPVVVTEKAAFPTYGSPMSKTPDAVAAYTAGMQAFRDADSAGAAVDLERATKLDADFASAQLRRALVRPRLADADRAHLREALRRRASLGDHDRLLLDAVAPLASLPEDRAEVERRLARLVQQSPGDPDFTFELCRTQHDLGDYEKAKETCARAIDLDPGAAAPIRTRAIVLLRLEDVPGALAALAGCLRASPLATSCLAVLKQLQAFEGQCDDALVTIRRILSLDRATDDDYGDLASVLFAKGEPIEAVRGALDQRHAALPPDRLAWGQHQDAAALAVLTGDFASADAELRALDPATAKSSDEADHVFVAIDRIQLAEETGRTDDARRLAQAYLAARAAWSPTSDDDYSIFFSAALYRLGAIGRDDFVGRRTKWLEWKKAQPRGGFYGASLGLAWISAYAAPALSASDAHEALAALPDYAPLPDPLQRSPDFEAPIGHVYLLAGRDAEAVTFLRRAANSCAPFTAPFPQTHAMFELGAALAKLGDTGGACDAYRAVLRRWGGTKSITARRAKTALGELRCSP